MKERTPLPEQIAVDPVEKVRAFLEEAGYEGEIHFSEETIRTVDDASRSVGAPRRRS